MTRLGHVLAVAHDRDRAGFDRARGHVDAFGLLDDDFCGRAHPDFEAFGALVELEGDVVADGAAAARRHLADAGDVRRTLRVERFDRDGRDLAFVDAADFRLAERTTSCSDSRLLSTANEEELDAPRRSSRSWPPRPRRSGFARAVPEELLLDELLELGAALLVPVPDTVSPTSPESVTIVPLWGA